MATPNMSEYTQVFLEEAEELLESLDEELVRLEQEKTNRTLLNDIFRVAHTLKGSSASMGFDDIAELTHEMESLLDKIRQGEGEVTSELIDVLLESLDALRSLVDKVAGRSAPPVEVKALVSKLELFSPADRRENTDPGPSAPAEPSAEEVSLTDSEESVIKAAQVKGFHTYKITVRLDSGCQMKSVRAYLVFNRLEKMGEIIKAIPPIEDIEAEKFDRVFVFFLITQAGLQEIEEALDAISELESVWVERLELNSPAPLETAEAEEELPHEYRFSQTVRVDVGRLDNLMNLVGELVIDRTRVEEIGGQVRARLGSDPVVDVLEEVSTHLGRLTGELQEEIMKARMLPIDQVFNRFPRMVRDLARRAQKEINFIIKGRETELDRSVIEEISDPLIHLLRNAVDHGIEEHQERIRLGKNPVGTIAVKAFHYENQIIITVEDDGRGMDPEALRQKAVEKGLMTREQASRLNTTDCLNLIFLPGFSTSKEITDISGRGVGMDIVREQLEKINGTVDINTQVGKGTKFTIRLPLTLAINRSLMVKHQDVIYAFPLVNVMETIRISPEEIKTVHGRQVIVLRGSVLPLCNLNRIYGGPQIVAEVEPKDIGSDGGLSVVVVGTSDKRVGIVVDELLGEQEIVIKSLGDFLGRIPGIAGATILGNGSISLILDVRGFVEQAGLN